MNKKKKNRLLLLFWIAVFLFVLEQSNFMQVANEIYSETQSVINSNNKAGESNQTKVNFVRKVDGDTVVFEVNSLQMKCRLLAIDTPESVKLGTAVQPYAIEAGNYTESVLKDAKEIIIEFDPNSDEKDKYGRYLTWVWVDGKLLQEKLLEKGYAKIEYVYAEYLYLDILEEAEQKAKQQNLGIWKQS